MRFYKNVEICDIESILKKGILSAKEADNFCWKTGKRSANSYDVVYLFSPLGKKNTFKQYGAALLAIDLDSEDVKENEMTNNDSNRGDYIEYIIEKVNPGQIAAIYIPELFKDKCRDLPQSVLEKITWCGMEEEGVSPERLAFIVKDMPIWDGSLENMYFRGRDEHNHVFDFDETIYTFPGYDTEERVSKTAKPYEPQREIVTEKGETVTIAADTVKVYWFNNKDKKVAYTAKTIKNGQKTTKAIEWVEKRTLESVEERLASGGAIQSAYARLVHYDSTKNDPDGEIWQKVVKFVKEHEEGFFTKAGDFRRYPKKEIFEELEKLTDK